MMVLWKQVWTIWKPLVTSRQHIALLLVIALSVGWKSAFPHDMRPLLIGAVTFTLLLAMHALYRHALLRLRAVGSTHDTGSTALLESIGLGKRARLVQQAMRASAPIARSASASQVSQVLLTSSKICKRSGGVVESLKASQSLS